LLTFSQTQTRDDACGASRDRPRAPQPDLNLNFVECSGVVSTEQLGALAALAAQRVRMLKSDSLNIERGGALA
jgi:hypothetical protein